MDNLEKITDQFMSLVLIGIGLMLLTIVPAIVILVWLLVMEALTNA